MAAQYTGNTLAVPVIALRGKQAYFDGVAELVVGARLVGREQFRHVVEPDIHRFA